MPRGQRRIELMKRGRQSTTSDKDDSFTVPEIVGCPVLDPIQCQCPKDDIDPSEGVKMSCTWESCPYLSKPLHQVCYQLLEDNLVKRLATLGSARGWTVPQRRNNLWEKKGQALIGKFCRCRCERGQMTRDKQALYEKERAVEKEKKKKAKKAKQLPQLQFNTKPSATIEDKKRDVDVYHSPSPLSNNKQRTFSTSTRSRLLTDRSSSTIRTFNVGRMWSESSFAGETNGQYDNNEKHDPSNCECVFNHDYDADEDHIDVDFDLESIVAETIVPAPLPPPQSRSYAASIKNVPLKKATKVAYSPDSGLEQPTPRLSFSSTSDEDSDRRRGDCRVDEENSENLNPLGLSILSPADATNPNKSYGVEHPNFPALNATPHIPKKMEFIRTQRSISMSKLPLAEPSLNNEHTRCRFNFNSPVRNIMDVYQKGGFSHREPQMVDDEERRELIEYGWTPFFGKGFNLGERLYYIP